MIGVVVKCVLVVKYVQVFLQKSGARDLVDNEKTTIKSQPSYPQVSTAVATTVPEMTCHWQGREEGRGSRYEPHTIRL